MVHKAVEMKKAGKSLDETAEWMEKHKLNMVHVFTVDDLFNLHRGGRVSRATAIVGTLASIKPDVYKRQGVLCTPGSSFGELGKGHVRFALTLPVETITEAVEAVKESGILAK